jgi:3-hydroxyacyl-[acyl-carrier-protein] dehydratase
VSGLQDSTNSNSAGVSLPLPARLLVPHRPPMLIIHQLLERNEDTTLAEAMVPTEGIFLDPQGGLLPEYFIELIAQSVAAINGFDARKESRPPLIGYLVGIDNFSWIDKARPGETLQISLKKTFEFQAVTIMEGRVIGPNGLVAYGELKVWEEKE